MIKKYKYIGMFNKIMFYILFLLISSALQLFPTKLETYGSITVNQQSVLYLCLDEFKSGDTLYFEVSFDNGYNYESISLGFLEFDDTSSPLDNFVKTKSSSYSKVGYSSFTFYFSYTLKENKKYLIIITSYFVDQPNTTLTIRHTKGNNIIWIIIVCVIVVIIMILAFICWRRRRKYSVRF